MSTPDVARAAGEKRSADSRNAPPRVGPPAPSSAGAQSAVTAALQRIERERLAAATSRQQAGARTGAAGPALQNPPPPAAAPVPSAPSPVPDARAGATAVEIQVLDGGAAGGVTLPGFDGGS